MIGERWGSIKHYEQHASVVDYSENTCGDDCLALYCKAFTPTSYDVIFPT
jgi:hypothetical protein